MEKYQNILVVIDPHQDDQPALRRAVYLVKHNGGHIKALLPIYDFSYDVVTALSPEERSAIRKSIVAQRTNWLNQQCAHYLADGVAIEIKVVWHNRPFEAIIREVIKGKHDLLIKMARQYDKLESVIFTPTDWHLLRKCPCPVWMVKNQPWPENGSAIVALNLISEEGIHDDLNTKLVQESLELATCVNHKSVHLVSTYPVPPISIAMDLPQFDLEVYHHAIRSQYLIAMKALRQKFHIDEKFTHVKKGMPEDVIPQLADSLNAGIVVLGSVGRTGFSAALIGNTAEHIINKLKCDLLVIKPDGFNCPIDINKIPDELEE